MKTRNRFRQIVVWMFALIAGFPMGWLAIGLICSVPGIHASNACGHNAYFWIPIALPLGIWVSWMVADYAYEKILVRR